MDKFPCTGCGACCKRISKLKNFLVTDDTEDLMYFPYQWDENGICENLNQEDNTCNIYESRPTICNVEKIFELSKGGPKEKQKFYKINAEQCNRMIEEDGLDEKFKIYLQE
jgi:Fe-S-cluster containining protein